MERTYLKPSTVAWMSLLAGVLVLCISAAVVWGFRDNLPARVAIHWGADGVADGFMELSQALVLPGLIGLTTVAFLVGVGAVTKTVGLLGPMAVGMAAFLAVIMHGTLLAQAGGAEPAVGPFLFLGLVAGVVVSLAGILWLRGRLAPVPADETGTFAPALPGHPEVRTWTGRTRVGTAPRVMAIAIAAGGLLLVALAGFGDPWLVASILLLTVGVAALTVAVHQRVVVDEHGVTTTFAGLRLTTIPLGRMVSAGHVEVEALGEYGGFGSRASHDGRREGLVTSSGPALIVQRKGQKDWVVTVDEAPQAARVLAMHIAARGGSAE